MTLRQRPAIERVFRPAVRFFYLRILHVDDSSARIAMGFAAGLFAAFTPFLGFHMLLALGLAALLRGNKALAVLFVWVSNPLTQLPISAATYFIGRLLMGYWGASSWQDIKVAADLLSELFSFDNMRTCLHSLEFWKKLGVVFSDIGLEMTIGGLALGLIFGVLGYYVTYTLVRRHRIKAGRRRHRHLI